MNDIIIYLTGFLPTWLALATLYYRMGRLEQKLKDIKYIMRNNCIKNKGGEIWE